MSPRRLGVTPAEASSGADLGCSSEYSIGCRVANTPLCVVEDWSGAGFRIKQPLNAGQPIVRQVVNHQTTKATRRMCVPRRRTLSPPPPLRRRRRAEREGEREGREQPAMKAGWGLSLTLGLTDAQQHRRGAVCVSPLSEGTRAVVQTARPTPCRSLLLRM